MAKADSSLGTLVLHAVRLQAIVQVIADGLKLVETAPWMAVDDARKASERDIITFERASGGSAARVVRFVQPPMEGKGDGFSGGRAKPMSSGRNSMRMIDKHKYAAQPGRDDRLRGEPT